MSKRALEWYQYLAPAVLTPLSFWLWWQYYGGELWLVLTAWLRQLAVDEWSDPAVEEFLDDFTGRRC